MCSNFFLTFYLSPSYASVFVGLNDYSTSGISAAVPINIPDSVTPLTRLRTVRLKIPSKALLPPYSYIIPTTDELAVYKKLIIHTKDEERSRIRKYDFLTLIYSCPCFMLCRIIC